MDPKGISLKQIECLQCVENSWWKAGEKLTTVAYAKGIDISTEFKQAVSRQRCDQFSCFIGQCQYSETPESY